MPRVRILPNAPSGPVVLAALGVLVGCSVAYAAEPAPSAVWADHVDEAGTDRLPRLVMRQGGALVDLPCEAVEITVEIIGPSAIVEVKQRFENPQDAPLDAFYGFVHPNAGVPVSSFGHPDAGSPIEARVAFDEHVLRTAWAARKDYDPDHQARLALNQRRLEEPWPAGLALPVSGIPPSATIEVSTRFGMVVQPRGRSHALTLPIAGSAPADGLNLRARADAGTPITAWATPGHDAEGRVVDGRLQIDLTTKAPHPPPFVVQYTVGGPVLEPVVLTRRDPAGDGGDLTLMVYPPAGAPVRPREVVLVLDRSRSMNSWSPSLVPRLVDQVLARLRPKDTFDIIFFGNGVARWADPARAVEPAARGAASRWLRRVYRLGGQAGADLLKQALERPPVAGRDRHFVFATDGRVDYGAMLLDTARDHVATQRAAGLAGRAFVFSFFARGTPYDDACVTGGLAAEGRGAHFRVSNAQDLDASVDRLFRAIDHPVLTDVEVRWSGSSSPDGPAPMGRWVTRPAAAPDLLPSRPIALHQRFSSGGEATVTVSATRDGQPVTMRSTVDLGVASTTVGPLAWVWSRETIARFTASMTVDLAPAHVRAAVADLGSAVGAPTLFGHLTADRRRADGPAEVVEPFRAPPAPLPWPVARGLEDDLTYDGDGDGVRDMDDPCHTVPEDMDGVQDDDGCPEEDFDGDGLDDHLDECPLDPENINERRDDDGCPESPYRGRLEDIRPTAPIRFAPGTARPTRDSAAALDEVADFMDEFRRIDLVRIEAHTDGRGPRAANRRLSVRRAEAVRRALMERGIAAHRLEAHGFGEEQPITLQPGAAARSQNRRVDFVVVKHRVKTVHMPLLVEARRRPLPPPPPPPVPAHEIECPGTWVSTGFAPPSSRAEWVSGGEGHGPWRGRLLAEAGACHRLALTTRPDLEGEVTVSQAPTGPATVEGIDHSDFARCLIDRLVDHRPAARTTVVLKLVR